MKIEQILKEYGLKNTGCRKHIIKELMNKGEALSEKDIKDALPDLFDRVTFYRSLKTLEEVGLIHKIVLDNSVVKYALNFDLKSRCEHPHFHCVDCDKVICMQEQIPQNVQMPGGYNVLSAKLLLEGVCPSCRKDSEK